MWILYCKAEKPVMDCLSFCHFNWTKNKKKNRILWVKPGYNHICLCRSLTQQLRKNRFNPKLFAFKTQLGCTLQTQPNTFTWKQK